MQKRTLAAFLVLLLVALPAAAATVKITHNRTPLRTEPTSASPLVAYYQRGDVLELVDVQHGWYKVRDPRTGKEGWVMASLAELLPGKADLPQGPDSRPPAPAVTPPGHAPRAPLGQPPAAPRSEGKAAEAVKQSVKKEQAGTVKPLPSRPVTQARPVPRGRWTDVAYVFVNAGYQAGTSGFSDTFTFQQHVEDASITTQYPKKDAPAFGGGVAFRVWRNLAASVSLSSHNRSTTGQVSGSIPHPFHYRADRPVAGTVALDRTETAVHVAAAYVVPVGRRVLVTLAAGPSYFTVKQSLVEWVNFTETYPYDEAALNPVTPTRPSASKVGFNAGIDLGYYFTKIVGVGLNARYAGVSLSLPAHGGNVAIKAGGFQAGAGLRIRIPKPAPKPKAAGKPTGGKAGAGTKPGAH